MNSGWTVVLWTPWPWSSVWMESTISIMFPAGSDFLAWWGSRGAKDDSFITEVAPLTPPGTKDLMWSSSTWTDAIILLSLSCQTWNSWIPTTWEGEVAWDKLYVWRHSFPLLFHHLQTYPGKLKNIILDCIQRQRSRRILQQNEHGAPYERHCRGHKNGAYENGDDWINVDFPYRRAGISDEKIDESGSDDA